VHREVLLFLMVFTMTFVITFGLLSLRPYSIVDGVTGFGLAGGCKLYHFNQPAQPMNTWVLACPRKDMIRLWPLPVQQPWFEDWWRDKPDLLTG
jgi:hypothetical protein